jgi:thiosulfate/3-mercaptopyruvate sulfurtransferase
MTYTTLISTSELNGHLDDPDWAIVDARFVLSAPEQGKQNYLSSHIPGAIYAHLDRDLSSEIIPGKTGRHPWPGVDQAAEFFSKIGIGSGVQVISYDDAGGALAAVRVWWMLRWLGHDAAAVLDGGWQKWIHEERPVRSGLEQHAPRNFIPRVRPETLVDVEGVDRMRQDPAFRVFDARTADRYRGENETIDPVAGHIPGAYSAPYVDNLDEEGKLKPPDELRAIYKQLLGGVEADKAVFYCGSGVTSIHDVLAMEVAGLPGAMIYPGSWSEWIAPRTRPIAT